MLRYLTAGESHGQGLVVILEGLPAGLELDEGDIAKELQRRRLGAGRGPRQRFEKDAFTVLGGVRHGRTLGSPLAITIENAEWPKWVEEMSPEPGETANPLVQPRPGHADLAGMQKYGFRDARNVLERASARETAARVAAGAVAKVLLAKLGVTVLSHVVEMGGVKARPEFRPEAWQSDEVDEHDVRCLDVEREAEMLAAVKAAAKVGDSIGGAVEVLAFGVPVGLGSHVQWDRKIDGLLGQALLSIPAVKAVELGDGLNVAGERGSVGHDAVRWDAREERYVRDTSKAGGIEGGITNGGLLRARVWMKPLATLSRPVMETVNVETKETGVSFRERTDVSAVPAMGVIAESMVSLVLASEALRKFGGDSLGEMLRNAEGFRQQLREGIGE